MEKVNISNSLYQTSFIEQQFLEYLENDTIKVVSFDIFDTLVFRTVQTHNQVFEEVGKNKLLKSIFSHPSTFVQYRQSAEKKALQHCSYGCEITFDDIYNNFNLSNKLKNKIQQIELNCENKVLVPNYHLDRWIKLAYEAGKEVILISDMYLSYNQIYDIALCKLSNYSLVSKVFVSSEYNCRKSTGHLYYKVQDYYKIEFKELLHIGDNIQSDNKIANGLGINTIYYNIPDEEQLSLKYEHLYLKKPLYDGNHLRKLSSIINPYSDELSKFYYNLGALFFAPILWEFSHYLYGLTKKHKLVQLNFLMREGAIFSKYFKMLYPEIETNLIYASRESTFLPILDEDSIDSLNFNLYKEFTLKNFYNSYNLEINNHIIKKYEDTSCKDASLINIGESNLLEYLVDDIKNRKDEVIYNINQQKNYLKNYLEDLGIKKQSAIIDSGGGGTVICRISDIVNKKDKPKLGVLLFEHSDGYNNLVGKNILPFFPTSYTTIDSINKIWRTCHFIEVLLNGPYHTTSSYTQVENKILPILSESNCNIDKMEQSFSAFTKGIDTFFAIANDYNAKPNTFDYEELALILGRLIDLPTTNEVNYLGNLEYDEGRGGRDKWHITEDSQIQIAKDIGIEKLHKEFLANTRFEQNRLFWIQGLISKINPDYLPSFYKLTYNPNNEIVSSIIKNLDPNIKNVFIYGAGVIFLELLPHILELNIHIDGVIDSRAEAQSYSVAGYDIVSLATALSGQQDVTIIVANALSINEIVAKIVTYTSSNNIKLKSLVTYQKI
jgi:predicted HAD superfamily hydrolase